MTDRDDALTDHSAALPSRRAVLLGAGALGAAGLLAACGDDPPADPEAPQEAGTTAPPATTAPESTPGGESETGDITTAQVPVGSGVIVQARNAVVTQPYHVTPPRSSAMCGRIVITASDSKATRVTIATSPTVSAR